jgi:hypothetical protein
MPSATKRATMSVEPPAANGTTSLIGRCWGYGCACAQLGGATLAKPIHTAMHHVWRTQLGNDITDATFLAKNGKFINMSYLRLSSNTFQYIY